MRKYTLFIIALLCVYAHAQTRYVGGDISMLPRYEQDNSYYKDVNNQRINNLLTWFITDCGWNTFRVRIFVNPKQIAKGATDYSVCQDLAYVTALGKRIKAAGAYFMLDFHYSDEWVDATHIQAPVAWQNADAESMADSIGTYTHRVLQTLKAADATPDFVQVGNEIMYGLCGIKVSPYNDPSRNANWPAFLNLVKAGCNAVRDECPEAKIIIHTDHPERATDTKYYYDKLVNNDVDFDIIGLSYYPFWHGYLSTLVTNLNSYKSYFPNKELQIVEFAYNFQNWPTSGVNYDTRDVWPCSVAGQYNFVKDFVDALKPLEHVTGISYWFPEEAGNGDYVNWTAKTRIVIDPWLNRGFWNENKSTSGHAINKTGSVSAEKTAADVCAPYYMHNFYNGGQGLEDVQPAAVSIQKTIREGRIVIERDGKMFDVTGAHVQ